MVLIPGGFYLLGGEAFKEIMLRLLQPDRMRGGVGVSGTA